MLKVGFFEDFGWRPTVLVWGDSAGMQYLHRALVDLDSGRIDKIVLGNRIKSIDHALTIVLSTVDGAIINIYRDKNNNNSFELNLEKGGMQHIIELVDPLLRSKGGHQYIDPDNDIDMEGVISANEYPENLG